MPQQETPVGPYIPAEGSQEEVELEGGSILIDLSPSSEQIQEQNDHQVIGTDSSLTMTQDINLNDLGIPELLPNETVYKKRLVKISGGKIVASQIVYIKRYLISGSGGNGDGYLLLRPDINGTSLTFTPVDLTLK